MKNMNHTYYNDCIINFTYDIGYNVYVQDVGDERIDFDLPVVVTENSYGFQLPVLSYPGTVREIGRASCRERVSDYV